MPDLVFATKGQAAVLRAQEDMKKQAQQLAQEFKRDTAEAEKLAHIMRRVTTGSYLDPRVTEQKSPNAVLFNLSANSNQPSIVNNTTPLLLTYNGG